MLDEVWAAQPSAGGAVLLEEALYFALATLRPITPRLLTRRTPCHKWDLMMLLLHLGNSLGALHEGMHSGRVALGGRGHGFGGLDGAGPAADPVSVVRLRAVRLLRSCATPRAEAPRAGTPRAGTPRAAAPGAGTREVAIGDAGFPSETVAGVGAIEVAVHAWDIAQAMGAPRPIPPALADDLLKVSHMAVPESGRYPMFAEPVEPPPSADSSDRLVAFLGRRPL